MKEIRDILADIGIVAVVLVLALPLLYKGGYEPKNKPNSDTIYVYDTIRIVEPTIIKEEVVRYEKVYLQTTDTIVKIDSVEVVVPISERMYEDSTYRAIVRGYKPELVSLDIYNATKYYPVVEKVKIKPKIAISAGLYGGFGNNGASYGLGVMVGVPIWSW